MKKNKYIPSICIFACFLLLWEGCTRREFCPPPEDMDFEEIAPLTPELKADIYYDASFSMVGVVKLVNSYNKKTLNFCNVGLPIRNIGRIKVIEGRWWKRYEMRDSHTVLIKASLEFSSLVIFLKEVKAYG